MAFNFELPYKLAIVCGLRGERNWVRDSEIFNLSISFSLLFAVVSFTFIDQTFPDERNLNIYTEFIGFVIFL